MRRSVFTLPRVVCCPDVYPLGKYGLSIFKPAVCTCGKSVVLSTSCRALRARSYAGSCLLFNKLLTLLLQGKLFHLLYNGNGFLLFFHVYKRDNNSDFLPRYSSSSIKPPSNSSLISCNFPLISSFRPTGGATLFSVFDRKSVV